MLATRLIKSRPWCFYVYELGEGQYIGKGTSRRLQAQKRRYGLPGREIARFGREKDAYAFERELIAELKPPLNRSTGGNGSRASPQIVRRSAAEIEMARVGTRVYVARALLRFDLRGYLEPSKIDELRRVANAGP